MSRSPKLARTRAEILDAAWALISQKGAEVSIDGEELLIMKESDILGITAAA